MTTQGLGLVCSNLSRLAPHFLWSLEASSDVLGPSPRHIQSFGFIVDGFRAAFRLEQLWLLLRAVLRFRGAALRV